MIASITRRKALTFILTVVILGLSALFLVSGGRTFNADGLTSLTQAGPQIILEPTIELLTLIPTATPTTPSTPTPMPTATLTMVPSPTWTPQPGVPAPAPALPEGEYDIFNVLLVGSDSPQNSRLYRSDSLIVISINRTMYTVTLLSIPRDLYVYIPKHGMDRINTATVWGELEKFPGGGMALLRETIRYNFGIFIDRYARIDFDGFEALVNLVGGIDVVVDCPLTDTINFKTRSLNVGVYHMDGDLALWYARSRVTTSDFERNRRQQIVLRALWHKIVDQGFLEHLPTVWDPLLRMVDTDFSLLDAAGFVPFAVAFDTARLRSYFMYSETVGRYTTPSGGDVLVPKPDAIHNLLRAFYTPPTFNLLNIERPSVEVLNGTKTADWSIVATSRLQWEGFHPINGGPADNTEYPATLIVDYTGGAKPGSLKTLARAMGVTVRNIVNEPKPDRQVDFRVVLGASYNSCAGVRVNTAVE